MCHNPRHSRCFGGEDRLGFLGRGIRIPVDPTVNRHRISDGSARVISGTAISSNRVRISIARNGIRWCLGSGGNLIAA
jgi:hypothetical protein